MSYPASLHTIYTLIDNTDDVLASHPNTLSAEIRYLEDKVGVDNSSVVTSIDYFLKHISGAYRTHLHDGSSDDGAKLDWDSCWSDAVHNHSSDNEGGLIALTTGVTGILPVLNGGTGSSTQNFVDLTTNQTIAGIKTFASQIVLPSPLQTSQGGTGVTANANAAGGVVVPSGAVNSANGAVVLDSNSKISVAQFGTWASKSSNTTYQAEADGFITAFCGTEFSNPGYIQIKTDSNSSPTTVRARSSTTSGTTNITGFVFCPVKKGDYWITETNVSITVYWIPLGS